MDGSACASMQWSVCPGCRRPILTHARNPPTTAPLFLARAGSIREWWLRVGEMTDACFDGPLWGLRVRLRRSAPKLDRWALIGDVGGRVLAVVAIRERAGVQTD